MLDRQLKGYPAHASQISECCHYFKDFRGTTKSQSSNHFEESSTNTTSSSTLISMKSSAASLCESMSTDCIWLRPCCCSCCGDDVGPPPKMAWRSPRLAGGAEATMPPKTAEAAEEGAEEEPPDSWNSGCRWASWKKIQSSVLWSTIGHMLSRPWVLIWPGAWA